MTEGSRVNSRVQAALDLFFLLAFVFSVVVQVNDPDALPWVGLYGAAAAASVLAILRRGHWALPALVGVVAAGWAITIAPRVVGVVPFLDMFGAFEMESVDVEESREMYGLLIVAGWMAVLAVRGMRVRDGAERLISP